MRGRVAPRRAGPRGWLLLIAIALPARAAAATTLTLALLVANETKLPAEELNATLTTVMQRTQRLDWVRWVAPEQVTAALPRSDRLGHLHECIYEPDCLTALLEPLRADVAVQLWLRPVRGRFEVRLAVATSEGPRGLAPMAQRAYLIAEDQLTAAITDTLRELLEDEYPRLRRQVQAQGGPRGQAAPSEVEDAAASTDQPAASRPPR